VSPKVADPAVRAALIEQAARLIAEEGRDALTLRRLAAEVGVSTMAVYTHFKGMDNLRREVQREGFDRLAQHLAGVGATDDPVADLIVLGWAYHRNATTNPDLYRVMFMERTPDKAGPEVGPDAAPERRDEEATFLTLVDAVTRCLAAGRLRDAEALSLATQLWAAEHGVVSLEIAGMLDVDDAADCLEALRSTLMVGFGDRPDRIATSTRRARPRMTLPLPVVRAR
jgi:AcrR family transcriptional regulator